MPHIHLSLRFSPDFLPPVKEASLVAQRVKASCIVEDLGSIPGSGRSPGEGNGNQLLENGFPLAWKEQRVRHN